MKKRYLPFTVPRWLIWILIGVFLAVLGITIYGGILYSEIKSNKEEGFSKTIQIVLQETDMEAIDKVTRYHGDKLFHVVEGTTNEQEKAIAFVKIEDDVESTIHFYLTSDTVGKEEVMANWIATCKSCELIGINPAIANSQPLWELKYIDNQDRYVFAYFSLEDGSSYEQFKLRQSLY